MPESVNKVPCKPIDCLSAHGRRQNRVVMGYFASGFVLSNRASDSVPRFAIDKEQRKPRNGVNYDLNLAETLFAWGLPTSFRPEPKTTAIRRVRRLI